MKKSKIAGIGFNVPNNVVTNHDIEDMMDTTDEWIKTRSGIEERRWVEAGTANSDLALPACVEAIQKAGITPNEIDAIVVGTVSSDYNFPGMAPIIQQKLGITHHVPAYDISAACSAFIYLLEIGDQYIKTGKYKNVLLVGSDLMSTIIDRSPEGRATGVLFGDGSGADTNSTFQVYDGSDWVYVSPFGKWAKGIYTWNGSAFVYSALTYDKKSQVLVGEEIMNNQSETILTFSGTTALSSVDKYYSGTTKLKFMNPCSRMVDSDGKKYMMMRSTFNIVNDEWNGQWAEVSYQVPTTVTIGSANRKAGEGLPAETPVTN